MKDTVIEKLRENINESQLLSDDTKKIVTAFIDNTIEELQSEAVGDFTAYKIFKNDKVNSILSTVMRELDEDQKIALRDALIERTTPTPEWTDEKVCELMEWMASKEYSHDMQTKKWEFIDTINHDEYTTSELLQIFKSKS